MADSPLDLFGSLLEHSFKGVSFPTTQFTLDIRHDLAIHKFVDKDGAEIEGTGRAPLQFTARIPFINTIQKGPLETGWNQPLYPLQFRRFIDATANRATGILTHPEFGNIFVKTEHVHVVWDGEKRGGVFVDVTWLETVLDAAAIGNFLGGYSPTSSIADAAATADARIAATTFTTPQRSDLPLTSKSFGGAGAALPPLSSSFGDLANTIRSISDLPSLMNQQVGGKIDAIVANAKTVGAALDKVSSPLDWLMVQSLQKILQAGYGLRQTILASKRAIWLYPVQQEATMANLATQIQQGTTVNVDLGDLFVLNPGLLRFPVVPLGSTVRFYAS